MAFNSIQFILFLLIVVLLYFCFSIKKRWIVLLFSSSVFYCIAGVKYIPFITVTSLASYYAALQISYKYRQLDRDLEGDIDRASKKELKERSKKSCRRIMWITLIISLGILCYVKFTNKIIESVMVISSRIGMHGVQINELNIIIPLGISYYTFSTIGYVLDVYWRRYEAEKKFFKYLLYVLYFPHILQGPIARYNRLAPQLFEEHRFDYKRVCFGIQLMLWGYFKKIVIADRLSIFVNAVFGNWKNEEGFTIIIAAIFYSIYLYADFSGCVDIAKGMSQIFGITLDDNFRQPYFSKSVAEFWRRWHITLGTWFKDYLYMPVSVSKPVKFWSKKAKEKWGNKAGKNVVMISSLAVVWLATGLWHGTGWNYVIWGIWHGSISIISTLLESKYPVWKEKLHIQDLSSGWQAFRLVRTFTLTAVIPRILTRAGSVSVAIHICKRIFSSFNIWIFFDQSLYKYGLDRQNFWFAVFTIAILLGVSILKERGIQIRKMIAGKNIVLRWMIYYAAIFGIIIFGMYGEGYNASDFVYMNF